MIRWLVAFALLSLLIVPSAFAQFTSIWYYQPDPGNTALTTTCNGTTPLPDGRLVKFFWDVDSDGPDSTDPVAPLCDHPPQCEDGPPLTVGLNQFTMNGTAMELGAGFFYMETGFSSVGGLLNPCRFYLRVYEADGINILWTSAVRTLADGYQEIGLSRSEWTCGAGGPQCIVRDEHE
jgi:hypothetical protein